MASKLVVLVLVLATLGSAPFSVAPVYAGYVKSAYSEQELLSLEKPEETQVRQLRDQEVNQLRIALGRRSPSNRRADLYLRLAEIYLESYRAEFLLEGRAHEKRVEAGKRDPLIDRAHSKTYLFSGIKACKEILSFNIPYEKLDEVYYFLAFNYGELGDRNESLSYFNKLIRDYPNSPMVSEGYTQLGESAYANRDYKRAQEYFELAARKAPPDSLAITLHKLAWAFYRARKYDRAVDVMKQAIDASSQNSEKFLNLREEALRDMAVFMTESDRAGEAIDYFKKVAGDKSFYPKLLEKLGREYERNVEPARATQVYEALLKTNPDSETRFRVMVKLVDLDLRRAKYKEALARVHEISEPGGSDGETQVAAQNLRAMVRRTATENHEHYRKNQTRSSLEVAEAFYETYLNQFLKRSDPRKETPEIQMYLAEVKRDLGKPREASDLYRAVVDSRDQRYAKEAGALWTASLSDAIRKNSAGAPKTGAAKSTEPSALEKEYIEAADRLQDALGETSDGRDAALKAAEVEAGYKSTQASAIKRIKNLIKAAPASSQALTGARLWVQIYADQLAENPAVSSDLKDTIDELRGNSELLAADRSSGQGKLKALLADQEIRLKVTAIAKSEKNKDYADAAKGYEDFANESQSKELAEKAYANAIVNLVKAPDAPGVDRVSSEWLKRYPNSSKALDSMRAAASQLLIQGNFEAAAGQFRKVGETGQDPAALQTAARISDGVGNAQAKIDDLTTFLEKYPKNSARPGVLLDLAQSFEAQRDDSNASKYYKKCMEIAELEAECGARLGDLFLKGEDVQQAKAMFKKVSTLGGKKKEAGSAWVGYARYRLAERMEMDAHFDPLVLPEPVLKKAMDQRTGFLEPLSKAYMSAVEAGGPWAIASLNALASWAYRFADDIDQIAPPNNKPEVVARFKKGLNGLSEPLRKKAIATWADAYSKASSSEAYSPVLPDIADHLADARASSPHRAQGVRAKLRLSGMPADGGAEGKDAAQAKVKDRLTKNPQDANAWIDYGNLLWGSGKPVIAKLVYQYALTLQPKSTSAMNNIGVLVLNDGEEDWTKASEGSQWFREALKKDSFFLPAKMNLALLLNYYRLFSKAKPYWEQVRVKAESPDVEDGYATALQGLGQLSEAEAGFKKATELGANQGRFAWLYHEAARQSFDSSQASLAGEKCLGTLNGVSETVLSGFEKSAMASLKRACTQWSQK
jgi:tetratricopeptide (TPR) repeat protein